MLARGARRPIRLHRRRRRLLPSCQGGDAAGPPPHPAGRLGLRHPDRFGARRLDSARPQPAGRFPAVDALAAARPDDPSAEVQPAAAAGVRRPVVRHHAGRPGQPAQQPAAALRGGRRAPHRVGTPPEDPGRRRRGRVLRWYRLHRRTMGHQRAPARTPAAAGIGPRLRAAPRGRRRGRRSGGAGARRSGPRTVAHRGGSGAGSGRVRPRHVAGHAAACAASRRCRDRAHDAPARRATRDS